MFMPNAKQILEKGSIEVRVKISGMYKRHILKVVKEKSAFGLIPYLVGDLFIPSHELVRLAQELQLPIKCHGMVVFPKGKAAADFAERVPEKPKSLAHGRIMNESADSDEEDAREESSEEENEESEDEDTEEESGEEETGDESEEESAQEEPVDKEEQTEDEVSESDETDEKESEVS